MKTIVDNLMGSLMGVGGRHIRFLMSRVSVGCTNVRVLMPRFSVICTHATSNRLMYECFYCTKCYYS